MQKFPARVAAYENELAKLSAHRSELADSRKWEEDAAYGEPDDMQASEGMEKELMAYSDVVDVQVLSVDTAKKRISLTMRINRDNQNENPARK